MSTVPVGIRIEGKLDPSAKNSLNQLGGASDQAAARVDRLNRAQGASLGSFIKWNQGLELGKKALMALTRVFDMTVGQSIALRAETNANRVEWERLGKDLDRTSALLGDLFLPAAIALKTAIANAGQAMTEMSGASREALSMDIAEWAIKSGKELGFSLAVGARLAVMAIQGLKMAWHESKNAAGQFNAVIQKGAAGIAAAGAKAAEAAAAITGGREQAAYLKLHEVLKQGAVEFYRMGAASEVWGDQASSDAAKALKDMEDYKASITRALVATEGFLDKSLAAARKASKGLGSGIVGQDAFPVPGADAKAQVDAFYEHLASKAREDLALSARATALKLANDRKVFEYAAKNAELRNAIEERNAEKTRERAQHMVQIFSSAARATVSAFRGIFTAVQQNAAITAGIMEDTTLSYAEKVAAIQEKTMSAGEILAQAALQIGESILSSLIDLAIEFAARKVFEALTAGITSRLKIAAYAAEASAAAFAAYIGIPIAGPALAATAATTAYGAVMGMQALVPMATGGIVAGGTPGRDSVPSLLMPGEGVLTTQTTNMIARDLRQAGGRGGGGGSVVNVKIQTLERPSTSKWESMVEGQLAPAIRKGMRRGVIHFGSG